MYSAMSKCPKQLPQCVKIAERNVVIIVSNGVLCEVRAYAVTVSVNSLYMNQVPETIY